jgi:Cu/Ag efflux protein CusF
MNALRNRTGNIAGMLLAAITIAPSALQATAPFGLTHSPRANIVPIHEGHAGAQASGSVNSVDAATHSINISHAPIRSIGWPAMTMDFPVDPGVDLSAFKAGQKITFTLVRAKDGSYEVHAIQPATAN